MSEACQVVTIHHDDLLSSCMSYEQLYLHKKKAQVRAQVVGLGQWKQMPEAEPLSTTQLPRASSANRLSVLRGAPLSG